MKTRDLIIEVSQEVTNLLLEKNAAYGDSALNPVGIFSKGDAVTSLCVSRVRELPMLQKILYKI
jgi:hypothetical protein